MVSPLSFFMKAFYIQNHHATTLILSHIHSSMRKFLVMVFWRNFRSENFKIEWIRSGRMRWIDRENYHTHTHTHSRRRVNVMNVTEETEGKGDYGIIVNVRVIVVNSVWLIHNLCAVRLKLHEYAKPSRRKGI